MTAAAVKVVKQVPVVLYAAGGLLLLVVALKLYKFLKGIGSDAGEAADRVLDSAARAYVDATTDPVEFAEGIFYVLPNGTRIAPGNVEHVGGGKFRVAGVVYRAVEALGNGLYRAEVVG